MLSETVLLAAARNVAGQINCPLACARMRHGESFSGSLLLGTWPFLKELQTVWFLSFLQSMNRRYKSMLGYIFDIVEGRKGRARVEDDE